MKITICSDVLSGCLMFSIGLKSLIEGNTYDFVFFTAGTVIHVFIQAFEISKQVEVNALKSHFT